MSSLFYDVFRRLEDEEKLNCLNEVDMFCLHLVFQPRINAALDAFRESWNNHSVSTMRCFTPNQLFIQGALERNRSIQYPLPSQQHGVSPLTQSIGAVDVPRATFHACGALISILGNIDIVQRSDDLGYSMYCTIIHTVGCHLRTCDSCHDD